jgi:hypothetical protein
MKIIELGEAVTSPSIFPAWFIETALEKPLK